MEKKSCRSSFGIISFRVLLLLAGVIIASIIVTYGYVSLTTTSQHTNWTTSTETCIGSGNGNPCMGIWNATFSVSINFTGSWSASYIGFNTQVRNVSGSYRGIGYNSTTITFEAFGFSEPTLCMTATKQEPYSNSTLILTIDSLTNKTSVSNISVRSCLSEAI